MIKFEWMKSYFLGMSKKVFSWLKWNLLIMKMLWKLLKMTKNLGYYIDLVDEAAA